MSHISMSGYDRRTPSRSLRADFTNKVLRNASTARRRSMVRNNVQSFFKEPFSMKSIKFLRTTPGAALVFVVIATSGAGVYALSNWFGGSVNVHQGASNFSVDLSSCKGVLPPGVEQQDNRHAVQFKIMGNPHISAQDLQQDLLGQCEANSVAEFYNAQFPDAGFSSVGRAGSFKYMLLPGIVSQINGKTMTVHATGSKVVAFGTRTLPLTSGVSVYDQGQTATTQGLKVGDPIMFVAYSASTKTTPDQGTILDASDVQVLSIFKTQYNDGADASFDYQLNNVMPLDAYNQLHMHNQ